MAFMVHSLQKLNVKNERNLVKLVAVGSAMATATAVILSKSAAITIRGSQTFWEIVSRFLGKKIFLGRPQETTGDQKLLVKNASNFLMI